MSGLGREVPYSLDAEAGVLGSILLDAECLEDAAQLQPADFFSPTHATIFSAMLEIHAKNLPLDKYSLVEALRTKNELEKINGPEKLSELIDQSVGTSSVRYFASLVLEKARLRRLIDAGHRIVQFGYNGESDVVSACANAERAVMAVVDNAPVAVKLNIGEELNAIFESVENAKDNDDMLTSPWRMLDNVTGGFGPGELIVWAAAPKMGKSAAVLNLAHHVAREHGVVAFFSLEMSARATRMRHLAMLSGVSVRKQRRGDLTPTDWENFSAAIAEASDTPLHFIGREASTMDQIRSVLRQLRKTHGRVRTIVIDHVGFVADANAANSRDSKHERLDRVYRAILQIAEEFYAPVHCVQHISREGMRNDRPTLANIRDGGNPEGHAHAVIFPFRPFPLGNAPANTDESKLPSERQKMVGEFIIAASRDGDSGVLPMHFEGYRNTWREGKLPASHLRAA